MKRYLALVLFSAGCASFKNEQIKTEPDGTRIESRQRIVTFWDSRSEIAKLRASTTDKTQGLTVGAISQESESTNTVALIEAVTEAAVKAAVKSVVPVP